MQEPSPQSTADSDNTGAPPAAFAGDVKVETSSEPKSLGETIAAARKRELEQAKALREEKYEGGAYVRENVAAGIERKQEQEAKQEVAELEREERVQSDTAYQDTRARDEEEKTKRDEADKQKLQEQMAAKFDRAKRALSDSIRNWGKEAKSIEDKMKRVEKDIGNAQRQLDAVAKEKKDSKYMAAKLEGILDDLNRQKDRLEEMKRQGDKNAEFELRRTERAISDKDRQLRKLGDVISARSEKEREERTLDKASKELQALGKKHAELVKLQATASKLANAWQSERMKPDIVAAWQKFENDLQSVGIHI